MCKGDTILIWKLDRLGRLTRGLIELVEDLGKKGIHLSFQIGSRRTLYKVFRHAGVIIKPIERSARRQDV